MLSTNNNLFLSTVNDQVITEDHFNDLGYTFTKRARVIENLEDWKDEGSNLEIMTEDLIYLRDLKDDCIFSSLETNEYIAESDNKKGFDELKDILLKLLKL